MKAAEALIAYTPINWRGRHTPGLVKVGPLLTDRTQGDWTDAYAYTCGAAFIARRDMPEWQQIAHVFIDFHTMVARDGIDPKVAHEAFLAIDEYRQRMSPDIQGAEDVPESGN